MTFMEAIPNTHPRLDAVRLLGTDNHPLTVAVTTKAAASAPIVCYPPENLKMLSTIGELAAQKINE